VFHWERGINPPRLRAFSLAWRWSIGARLGIAFAAVAGLAVAANLLIEHEILITRTRVIRIPVPAAWLPAAIASRLSGASLSQTGEGAPKSLISAIDHYEAAIRSRLAVHSDDSDTQLASANRELEEQTRAYVSQPYGEPVTQHRHKLREHLEVYRLHGAELVRVADGRQKVLKEFWDCFEALDARTKAALAQSWKIFSRVIARRSLVDINSSLDEIRRGFASLPPAGLFDRGTLDAVTSSERALAASLQTNDVALKHSQGEIWVAQLHSDVTRIAALQETLIETDRQRRALENNFSQESQNLTALTNAAEPPSMARVGPATNLAPGAHTESPGEQTTETTSTAAGQPAQIMLMFWLSASVLMLLLWISIHTVMSVVGPVGRLRAATHRLAQGEARVRVRRGGIRELDDLAVSFNQMADQLAEGRTIARNYQEGLEATVTLRTRELRHLAEHDPLTQLPNRRQLYMHLKAVITRAQANLSSVGVFFVDLDNFKNINDTLGHAFGDRVLGAIAERLRARAGVGGFAARLGGDEFTVVCDGVVNVEGVSTIGKELVRAFQEPVAVDGRDLMVSISVGASVYPDHGRDAEALLRAADAALFRAKALGRSQLSVFSPALLEEASAKFSTEQGLRYALERGEFELVFQPEIDATTLSARVVEALLRWRLPDGRRASPGEFLAVAEESGLIMEISDWVLRTSIETAARWHHGEWPEARVAINLSSRQLLDRRFVDHVMALLREHRLPARCIEIELTENVLQTGAATIDVLRQLRDQGVAIALDDFGTGYSSLASLEKLPLTRVKLDGTLIASIHTSARSAAITRALVGLCHNIGLEVTAEGIESPEQLLLLADLAPIHLQGYLLARPVSAKELLSVMKALPNHMASLLLSSTRTDTAQEEAPPERSVPQLRAIRS
jgi:diguanylate cyclase (GGDEF)-like protein